MTKGQLEPQAHSAQQGGMAKPKHTPEEPLRSKLEAALARCTRGTRTLATLQAHLTEDTTHQGGGQHPGMTRVPSPLGTVAHLKPGVITAWVGRPVREPRRFFSSLEKA